MNSRVLKGVGSVEGWLTPSEMEFLFMAARKCSPHGPIVEIGSWKGKSTICIALGISGKSVVYAVDPHIGSSENKAENTLKQFKMNVRKFSLSRRVVPIVKKSKDAARGWKKPISMLWIDGSHEYEDVKTDFDVWEKHVIEGGIIAFHDSFRSGPSKIILDRVIKSKKYSGIGHVDYITFAVKKPARQTFLRGIYFYHAMRNFIRTESFQPRWLNNTVKKKFFRDFKKLRN